MSNFRKVLSIVLKLSFIGLAVWLITQKIDLRELQKIFTNANLYWVVLATLAAFISLSISSQRNRFYLSSYGLDLGRLEVFKLYMLGTFLNTFMIGGIGGDGYKIFLLKRRYNFPVKTALRVALYERTNGFYPLAMYFLLGVFFSSFAIELEHKVASIILFVICTPVYLFGVKYILRDKIGIALRASLYSYAVQVLQVLMAIFCCFALGIYNFGVGIDFLTLFLFASLISFIPISIGGIGLRELTLLYGLQYLEMPELIPIGVSFAFLSFICPIMASLIGLKFFLENPKKSVA